MKLNIYLIIIFILAILIPCSVLGYLAFRASSHEEAYLEKELKTIYSRELFHAAGIIREELTKIEDELDKVIVFSSDKSDAGIFKKWKKDSPLIKTAYRLSKEFKILYPVYNENSEEDEVSFLNWNKDFLRGNSATPVYTNILFAYKEDIAKESENRQKNDIKAENRNFRFDSTAKLKIDEKKVMPKLSKNNYEKKSSDLNSGYYEQQAAESLAQNKELQEKIYKKAEDEGKNVTLRNLNTKVQTKVKEKSLFISDLLKFQEIITDKEKGIIPRIIYDKQEMLFWKKTKDKEIIGCLINGDEFEKRIASLVSGFSVGSKERFMTVLNENGELLFTPSIQTKTEWTNPFVSIEISEILPRWELAVYLPNPELIKRKALFLKTVIIFLIMIMLFVIAAGSILIIRSLNYEINLASQKTTFTANVSHELKTPLTSIRMFAEMLQNNVKLSVDKKNKYFNIMVSETERLTKLINNVLDFSKLSENKIKYDKKNIELCGFVRNVYEECKDHLLNKEFKFKLNCIKEEISVFADRDALKQALLNLLSNAEKYSFEKKDIEVSLSMDKEYAYLKVSDKGIGIDQKYARKIFKEFFRVDDSLTKKSTGTGLGLAIAERIIREHNGKINFKNRDGGGSEFIIKLPLLGEKNEK